MIKINSKLRSISFLSVFGENDLFSEEQHVHAGVAAMADQNKLIQKIRRKFKWKFDT